MLFFHLAEPQLLNQPSTQQQKLIQQTFIVRLAPNEQTARAIFERLWCFLFQLQFQNLVGQSHQLTPWLFWCAVFCKQHVALKSEHGDLIFAISTETMIHTLIFHSSLLSERCCANSCLTLLKRRSVPAAMCVPRRSGLACTQPWPHRMGLGALCCSLPPQLCQKLLPFQGLPMAGWHWRKKSTPYTSTHAALLHTPKGQYQM